LNMVKRRLININPDDPEQLHDVLRKCYTTIHSSKADRNRYAKIFRDLETNEVPYKVVRNSTFHIVTYLDKSTGKETVFGVRAGVVGREIAKAREGKTFRGMAHFIDLILEPEAAESAIGDLAEGFQRRAPLDLGHATRWLWAQVARLTFHRALDIVRSVALARAGK